MSMKRTIGTFVVVLTVLTFAPQVNAGPVVALYGENAFGFTLRISHGAIVGPGVDVHAFMVAPPFSQFWQVSVGIRGENRVLPGGVDSISILVVAARHIAGVPGHVGEGPNPVNLAFGLGVALPGGYAPGNNVFQSIPAPNPHPPIEGHADQFRIVLTFNTPFVGEFAGRDIDNYTIDITGVHCFDNICPIAPSPTKSVSEVPEPSSLLLLGTNFVGLLGYGWRRHRLRKSITLG